MHPGRKLINMLLAWAAVLTPAVVLAEKPREPAVLAGAVPPDARLFLEVSDVQEFLGIRAGREFAELLSGFVPSPTTRPASRPVLDWQQTLGKKLGLRSERAAQMLFSGRLALAADSWNDIEDVVLLAAPSDVEGLEAELQALRIADTAGTPVRRYRLEASHELCCDGRIVVAGQRRKSTGLYPRTVALWVAGRRVTLADLADFRERVQALPAESHIIFYSGPQQAGLGAGPSASTILWPNLKCLAVGVVMNGKMVTVETSARLIAESETAGGDPPIESLLRVPASTLVAWTHLIRYVEEFRRIDGPNPDEAARFYLEVIQAGLPPGGLEDGLLRHLVGDTIFMVGQRQAADGDLPVLPVIGLAVETDDPDAVGGVLRQIEENVVKLLNLQPRTGDPLAVEETPLDGDEAVIRSLPLGRYLANYTNLELLSSLEISWTVADRWLVLASDLRMVREIVETRRGGPEPMAAGGFGPALARVKQQQGGPQMVLIARPQVAAAMIDSWIGYIDRRYPDMRQANWWQRLRQRQLAGSVQLGIVPKPTTQPGVLVERTLPGWPAHSRLRRGDRILAVDGNRVDTDKPQDSLRDLVANRQKPGAVTLWVVRDGRGVPVSLTMLNDPGDVEPIQPLELLGNFADLLRLFSSASYITWQPSKELVNARLELELAGPVTTTSSPSTGPS